MRLLLWIPLAACSFRTVPLEGDAPPGSDVELDAGDGVDAPPPPIVYVQGAAFTSPTNSNTVVTAFGQLQTAGNLNVAVVSWTSNNDNVQSVTDLRGNTYLPANDKTAGVGYSQRIYYAANIVAGSNSVTARLSGTTPTPKIRIFEYAGLATTSPVDAIQSGTGNSTLSSSGAATTTYPRDLLFGANVAGIATVGPDTGWTQRQLDNGDLVEDQLVTSVGSYTATAPINSAGAWIMQLVAFKGAP